MQKRMGSYFPKNKTRGVGVAPSTLQLALRRVGVMNLGHQDGKIFCLTRAVCRRP